MSEEWILKAAFTAVVFCGACVFLHINSKPFSVREKVTLHLMGLSWLLGFICVIALAMV